MEKLAGELSLCAHCKNCARNVTAKQPLSRTPTFLNGCLAWACPDCGLYLVIERRKP